MHRRLAAAVTLSVTLLLGACTDDAPKPPPQPSSAPTMPSVSPGPSSPSPSSASDPDAADKAAIEKAYRIQFAEFNRLEMAGGAATPTETLKETTSGVYRRALVAGLRSDKKNHIRQVNAGKIVGVVVGDGNSTSRKLTACEDYSKSKWIKKDGTLLKVDQPILYVQHSTAKHGSDGKWRIDDTSTVDVKSFKSATCHGSGR